MFRRKPKIVEVEHNSNKDNIRVIEVLNGQSRLKRVITEDSGDSESYFKRAQYKQYTYEWRFDQRPLVYVNSASAPTSESMIMHGHGRAEIDAYFQNLNTSVSFKDVSHNLNPLLELLDSGYYTLTQREALPTDGGSKLFWNITNIPKNHVTSSFEYVSLMTHLNHYPIVEERFLFPSEFSSQYNHGRVLHYVDFYRVNGYMPFVITLPIDGALSLCLDGHHKACACALLGIRIPIIEIAPVYSFYNLLESEKEIKYYNQRITSRYIKTMHKKDAFIPFFKGSLNTHNWLEYKSSLKHYSKYHDLQIRTLLNNPQINPTFIEEAIRERDYDKLHYIIVTKTSESPRRIETLMKRLVEMEPSVYGIRRLALERLLKIKNETVSEYLMELVSYNSYPEFTSLILQYWPQVR